MPVPGLVAIPSRTDCTSYLLLPFHVSFIHTCTHTQTHTHAPTHTHIGHARGAAGPTWGGAMLGPCRAWGHLDAAIAVLVSRQPKKLVSRGEDCSVLQINTAGHSQLEALAPSGHSEDTLPMSVCSAWGSAQTRSCPAGVVRSRAGQGCAAGLSNVPLWG